MTLSHAPPARLESVAGAQRQLLDLVPPLGAEDVPVQEALGRVIAAAVVSRWDLPGFDNSAMDGYAVRSVDVRAASPASPVRLRVTGEARAGVEPPPLQPGFAMRIFTGAPLPAGADSVVRQEDTRRDGDAVSIEAPAPAGTSVRHRGEDITKGAEVLHPGGRVSSADIAVAAATGHATLTVGRRPRVAVLATGDELVAAGGDVGPGQVADSNSPMLTAAVREAGGDPVPLGVAADTVAALRVALRRAAGSDLVVSSAGVSVGDHDHVQEVLAELGEVNLWRVAMRPGKPLLIGRLGTTPFIGLPGNPVSSSVTFELFARPAILRMQGASQPHRPRIHVRLGEEMRKPAGLETYARVRLHRPEADLPVAMSSGGQGSHMLSSLTTADALVILPAAPEAVPAGTVVEAIPLRCRRSSPSPSCSRWPTRSAARCPTCASR